jgi:hypothetical protein
MQAIPSCKRIKPNAQVGMQAPHPAQFPAWIRTPPPAAATMASLKQASRQSAGQASHWGAADACSAGVSEGEQIIFAPDAAFAIAWAASPEGRRVDNYMSTKSIELIYIK